MTSSEYLDTLQDLSTAIDACRRAIARINARNTAETEEEREYVKAARHSAHLAATDLRDAQARLCKAAEYAEIDLDAAQAERDEVAF